MSIEFYPTFTASVELVWFSSGLLDFNLLLQPQMDTCPCLLVALGDSDNYLLLPRWSSQASHLYLENLPPPTSKPVKIHAPEGS